MKTIILVTLLFIMPTLSVAQEAQTRAVPDEYRHFIMPTGKPIYGGYLGVWELAFLQGGIGISDFISLSGGMTIMPTVSIRSQFKFLQAKATLADEGGISFALGTNFLWMTDLN